MPIKIVTYRELDSTVLFIGISLTETVRDIVV